MEEAALTLTYDLNLQYQAGYDHDLPHTQKLKFKVSRFKR